MRIKALTGSVHFCEVPPIAPSTYYDAKAKERDPQLRCARAIRDEFLRAEIQRVWGENFCLYGVRKVWRQLNREGIGVARCTTERLMNKLGLRGVVRGRRVKTTSPSHLAMCSSKAVRAASSAVSAITGKHHPLTSTPITTSNVAYPRRRIGRYCVRP